LRVIDVMPAVLVEPLTRATVEAAMARFVDLGFHERFMRLLGLGGGLMLVRENEQP
jgi:hypothetical protein